MCLRLDEIGTENGIPEGTVLRIGPDLKSPGMITPTPGRCRSPGQTVLDPGVRIVAIPRVGLKTTRLVVGLVLLTGRMEGRGILRGTATMSREDLRALAVPPTLDL